MSESTARKGAGLTTAIIGVGNIGGALARHMVAGGESVVLAAKSESRAEALAQELGPLARGASVEDAIAGADAVVFAAGAGPGSGTARKLTMDRDGAIKLLDAARAVGTQRYVIISSIGAESPPPGDEPFSVYLQAKAAADAAVAASDRDWTIVRPGPLTDDPGTGRVRLAIEPFRADVTRDDVAAVLAAALPEQRSHGVTMYLGGGDDPVEQALEAVT